MEPDDQPQPGGVSVALASRLVDMYAHALEVRSLVPSTSKHRHRANVLVDQCRTFLVVVLSRGGV